MSVEQSSSVMGGPMTMKGSPEDEEVVPIVVEFTGGLELLFSNQRKLTVLLPHTDDQGKPANLAFLVRHLCDNLMKDRRKEMFVLDGTVRPGILVLINDADWELEGGDQYEVQKNDNVLFVSTLHGG